MNKKTINGNGIWIRTLSKMRAYCSMFYNFSTFITPNEDPFLCLMCQIFGIWHIWESWWECSKSICKNLWFSLLLFFFHCWHVDRVGAVLEKKINNKGYCTNTRVRRIVLVSVSDTCQTPTQCQKCHIGAT